MSTTHEDAYKANRTGTGYYSGMELAELDVERSLDYIEDLRVKLNAARKTLRAEQRVVTELKEYAAVRSETYRKLQPGYVRGSI